MIKRLLICMVLILALASTAVAETTDWASAPVITKAYELSAGKLYLEWEGNAPLYQVYLDGKNVADSIVNNAIISVKDGSHTILVYPVSKASTADTRVDLSFNIISLDLDLAALGLDRKQLSAGTPSTPLNIDYTESTIFSATPDKPVAVTDFNDQVSLSFTDRYQADEYVISVKTDKDVNYVRFNCTDDAAAELIHRDRSSVTIDLSPEFLESQGCMIPELDREYVFTVQLRKYAVNLLDGEKIQTVIHESKESKETKYTPAAAWKTAPIITYASQTADGQISLEWTHDDNGLGCEYAVTQASKALVVKTDKTDLGITAKRSFVVNDLMNGKYAFSVIPVYNGESGIASDAADVDVQNDWVAAPALVCNPVDQNKVRLTWTAAEGIDHYHITAYASDDASLLRFVALNYEEYAEFDIPASGNDMEHIFAYEDEINPETGKKLKFEIYGTHLTGDGKEQKTAVSKQNITIGKTIIEEN